jgi:hypothetical protein
MVMKYSVLLGSCSGPGPCEVDSLPRASLDKFIPMKQPPVTDTSKQPPATDTSVSKLPTLTSAGGSPGIVSGF